MAHDKPAPPSPKKAPPKPVEIPRKVIQPPAPKDHAAGSKKWLAPRPAKGGQR